MDLDANNQLLPLAFALVESENNGSWGWFMRCIRIGVTQRDRLCVISDRHNGILHAMNEPEWKEPRAYHHFCSRHLASNFNTKVKNVTLKKTLSAAAYQNQLRKFARHYGELKDEMKNNTSDMLPLGAWKLSSYHWETSSIEHQHIDRAAFHKVEVYDREHGNYQVTTGRHHHTHNVNLSARTCSCGKWEAFHYPCSHVLAVCKMENLSHLQFVASEYTVAAYNATWSYKFCPMPDKNYWQPYEGPTHIPNVAYRRMKRGRNPTKRRRNEMDQDVSILTGLPINGSPVTGTELVNWKELCLRCFGVIPPRGKSPSTVKRTFFKETMERVPNDADEEEVKNYARAYLLCTIGSTLMIDLSVNDVSLHFLPLLEDLDAVHTYSWGSVILAYLYRQLCKACEQGHKQLVGCTVSLQLWGWEHFYLGRGAWRKNDALQSIVVI
ncbi:unnamed protein product [Rhodiola kirilowii]